MELALTQPARRAINLAVVCGGRWPFVVGGVVRDAVMGIESKDIDIEIHGMTEMMFRGEFASALREFGRVDEVGVSFGVIKFGHDIDISLPRRDSKISDGHRGFTIEVDDKMTIQEALSRRDFTMNAMAWDPLTKELIDPFGGQQDIADKVIRHVGPALVEDPLRVMRAVQFATRFGFRIAPETAVLCQSLLRELRSVSKERLWGEWEKILTKGTDFAAMHRALWATGAGHLEQGGLIMRSIFAFRDDIKAHESKIARLFAHSDDKAAAILGHWATSHRGGVPGHDEVHELFEALNVPHDVRRRARWFRDGMIFVTAIMAGHWTPFTVRQIARELPVPLRAVCLAAQDRKAAARVFRVALENGVLDGPHRPLIDGHALIELGMSPGPRFQVILKAALRAQDAGVFTSRDDAMMMAQRGGFG